MAQHRGLKMALNNTMAENVGNPASQPMKAMNEEDIVIIEDSKQFNYVNDSILSQVPMTTHDEKRGSGMGPTTTKNNF